MKNPFKTLDTYLIEKRLSKINSYVVDKFNKFGIKFEKIDIIPLNQKSLSAMSFFERSLNDISIHNDNIKVEGLYSILFNQILIDKNLIRFSSDNYISLVLSHEYAHMISSKYNNEIIKTIKTRRNKTNNFKNKNKLGLETKLILNKSNFEPKTIQEQILDSMLDLTKIKRTESEKRYFEFSIYVEEMFAQCIAENLYSSKNSEKNLKLHSQINSGDILSKDKDFFIKLETFLYKRLFHDYSKKSLKEIIVELPKLKYYLDLEYENHFKIYLK